MLKVDGMTFMGESLQIRRPTNPTKADPQLDGKQAASAHLATLGLSDNPHLAAQLEAHPNRDALLQSHASAMGGQLHGPRPTLGARGALPQGVPPGGPPQPTFQRPSYHQMMQKLKDRLN